MGTQNSKYNQVDSKNKQGDHPLLGKVRLFHQNDQTNQQIIYMETKFPAVTSKQVEKWIEEITNLKYRRINSQALFLPLSHQFQETGMCGNSGFLNVNKVNKVVYQYYHYLLHSQIENRIPEKKYFSEAELWFVLYTLVSGCAQFESDNFKIADVRPKNILLNENGLLKMVNKYSWPNQTSALMKTYHSRTICFLGNERQLAPQQLKALQQNNLKKQINNSCADAFSIGLTLLSAMFLINCECVYDIKNLKIKQGKIDELKQQLRENQQYTPFLIKTIENMLDFDVDSRPTCGQIEAILMPYEDQIKDLDYFVPNKQLSHQSFLQYEKKVIKFPHMKKKYGQNQDIISSNTQNEKQVNIHAINVLRNQQPTVFNYDKENYSRANSNIVQPYNFNQSKFNFQASKTISQPVNQLYQSSNLKVPIYNPPINPPIYQANQMIQQKPIMYTNQQRINNIVYSPYLSHNKNVPILSRTQEQYSRLHGNFKEGNIIQSPRIISNLPIINVQQIKPPERQQQLKNVPMVNSMIGGGVGQQHNYINFIPRQNQQWKKQYLKQNWSQLNEYKKINSNDINRNQIQQQQVYQKLNKDVYRQYK